MEIKTNVTKTTTFDYKRAYDNIVNGEFQRAQAQLRKEKEIAAFKAELIEAQTRLQSSMETGQKFCGSNFVYLNFQHVLEKRLALLEMINENPSLSPFVWISIEKYVQEIEEEPSHYQKIAKIPVPEFVIEDMKSEYSYYVYFTYTIPEKKEN